MTARTAYAQYALTNQALDAMVVGADRTCSGGTTTAVALRQPSHASSTGVVIMVPGYPVRLPRIGSSTVVVDCRRPDEPRSPAARQAPASDFSRLITLPVGDQMRELRAALSLNKSQLAQILQVARPTLYEWFGGREPSDAKTDRLHALFRVLTRASISARAPLNTRFVRKPMELNEPSILELLTADEFDEERLVGLLRKAHQAGMSASRRRVEREKRLRDLGFDDPTAEERRELLAKNMAMKDWAK
ncbi:MAG: hypothetical protein GXP55_18170 [Deltaproteobacteria bacterium]|nr:hypothetical protein [Deltaproteobacteria bacterium]